jgi:hypothetical protein
MKKESSEDEAEVECLKEKEKVANVKPVDSECRDNKREGKKRQTRLVA